MSGEGAFPRKPWWQQEGTIILALVLVFPLGVFLMWLYAPWQRRSKWILTGVAALAAIVILVIATPEKESNAGLSSAHPTDSAWESAPRSDFGFNYRVGYKVCGWDREQTYSEAGTRSPEAAARYYVQGLTSDAAPGGYAGCLDGLKGVRSRY